jgi:hypothetical protein
VAAVPYTVLPAEEATAVVAADSDNNYNSHKKENNLWVLSKQLLAVQAEFWLTSGESIFTVTV